MPPLLSAHRARAAISLRATEPHDELTTPLDLHPDAPPVAWPLAAAVAGIVAAAAGWILAAGLTVVGWLAAPPAANSGSLADALAVATSWWLLAHGAGALIGGLPVTLVPWGATLLFALVLARCTQTAVSWGGRRWGDGQPARWPIVAGAAALAWFGYATPVGVAAVLTTGTVPTPALAAVGLLLALAGTWGSVRALEYRPADVRPAWARALPRAVGAGLLVLLAGGAAAVVVGLARHLDRVSDLTGAVDAGVAGTFVLWLVQLAYVPSAVVWGGAYVLGAGFSLGTGSLVSPAVTQLGLLPGLPLLGGLPGEGPGDTVLLAWLAVGVLAGVVPAWIVARNRPSARLDETCLVGALSGIVVAVGFVILAWAASGDLGGDRLSGLGPRLLPLLVLGGSTLGLAGMGTGLILGSARWWRARPARPESPATEEPAEATTVLDAVQHTGGSERADATR